MRSLLVTGVCLLLLACEGAAGPLAEGPKGPPRAPRDGGEAADAGAPTMPSADAGAQELPAFVTRDGTELEVDNARLRFIGVNLRALPHYGTPALPYSKAADIEVELDGAKQAGATVVRVFAASDDAAAGVVAARLGRVLDGASQRGLYVIVALTDFYLTGLFPRGDGPSYVGSPSGLTLLSTDWFRSGFEQHYLPWVRTVVGRYGAHPAVLAWELGNELQCPGDAEAFLAFARTVGAEIHARSSHLVASGMITSAWLSPADARRLYASAELDLITVHDYDGAHLFDDSGLAAEAGKPFIVEEAGFERGDRPAQVDADVRWWVDGRGARGYLQWGFTAVVPDNGNGDLRWGMDRFFHSDFEALARTYRQQAARIR